MSEELKIRTKLAKQSTGYGFRVPKAFVDQGVLEYGAKYEIVILEIKKK